MTPVEIDVGDGASRIPEDLENPRGARLTLWFMAFSLAALTTWAALAEIDQVTRAAAQFIAADRTQLVQAPDGGVITQLHVKEGDHVGKEQILVTLEKERASAAVADTSAKVAALRAALVRLNAEISGSKPQFDADLMRYPEYVSNQRQLFLRRQASLQEEVGALGRILNIAEEELGINEQLASSGDVSRAEVLRLQKGVADVRAQITNRKNKYFQEAQTEMTKAQEELSTFQEQLRDRSQVLEHTELLAPADGIVNNIRFSTVGGVLRSGDVVMELLPTGSDLIAETKISPTDIAFVKVGQVAIVKVDAFDSTVFGGLEGVVTYISPDVIKEEGREGVQSYYRVHVLVKGAQFQGDKAKDIRLRPGMTGQVEILALKRSVLSYLTKPIVKTLSESLGER